MLTDAIELYLQLEMYEKAGDLCQQLNQPDEAREHYLQAVDAMQILGPQRDHLAISVLLEKKLQMQEAAMAELAEAWPGSTQPVACMRRWFDLAQHQAAPPEILQQIDRVANVSPALAFASAEVLFHVATTQQQEAVGAARNALQTLVAKSLLEVQPTRRNQLVSYLQRLDPADRLLIRDSRNFLERRAKRLAPPEAAPAKRVGRNTLVKRTELPPRTHWSSLCLLDDVLFIAGLRGGSLAVVAAPWGGDAANVELPWPKTMMSPATEIVLAAHSHEDSLILLHPVINRVAGHPLPLRPLRGITRRPKLQVGSATAGITIDTLSVCRGPHGLIWQASYTGSQLVLACYRGDQMVSSRVVIEAAELELPSELPRLSTNGTNVFLSWGEHLFIAATDKQEVLHDMPQEIRRLACSAPHSRPRVAMGYDVGGSILWNQQLDFKLLPFGEGLVNPEVCINRGGFLVAAGAKRIEVYSTRNTTLKLIGENEESSLNPVAVIGGPGSHQFAVLNDNRELLWYETA